MSVSTLEELYHTEMQDAYSACKQSLAATRDMGRAATDQALQEALIDATNGIVDGMDKLASMCAEHDINPDGHKCEGMEGLVKEARKHSIEHDFDDDALRDAMIISQYQRLGHYAIAAYGTLRAFANRLGHDGDGARFNEMLDSCYDGDRRMTDIATGEGGVNADAA
ncbi:DUF892 family protein [Aliishimia ponticola]|uniref:DUF892 family protein n=1 Tax=Aliishimia ponticola TaxID=2499833 RepID=A0A4V3XKS8_9RHOB|nr:DUF892 family protein [Aliishimia ponticola]THH38133.1 DUF892 family protein [Aliishimia ponticola]